MFRRIQSRAHLSWALIICLTCGLAVGCGGGSSNKRTQTPGINLSGTADDGGPSSPIPGANCRFVNDIGPVVGPVTAGADGRFTLRVPPNSTGRVECTPPGQVDLVLSARVAVGTTDLDIGKVDPQSDLIATILETEIGDGDLDPGAVGGRILELEVDEDLADVEEALNLVVDALLAAGLDAEVLAVILDLYDNGELDGPDFAVIADAVNAGIDLAVGSDDLVAAIAEFADLLFGDMSIMSAGKLLIEHNATDKDTGFQGFADGDPWNELRVSGPGGAGVLTVRPLGGLFDFGLTELFFETSEPPNDEVSIPDVLARLAEGDYDLTGEMVGGDTRSRLTGLSHDIPAGPVLVTPADGAQGLSPVDLLVSWQAVTKDIDGDPVTIVGYQVIVEEDAPAEFPHGFAKPVFSVYLPADATQVRVPNGFLKGDACYKYEVLAIEESGNQTLSSAAFETGNGCTPEEEQDGEEPVLTQAKLLIEHNATDEDTGFQGFGDGDPWNLLTITGPLGSAIVQVETQGGLFDFGLTELFFETSEPPNAEVSIANVLARLPEGIYTFTGDMVDGGISTLTAVFTHTIPAGPELVSPSDAVTNVDPAATVVSWQPVTTDVNGSTNINIVGYQVIVELDAPQEFPSGFAKPWFSIYLPATATQVQIPAEFMQAGADYKYEVLAIEESGNQTLSSAAFSTR